ncbi:hypothetical protein COO60DRAFT_1513179 [Scenedesmus sp. NREL 46B-D3]|nr:hypothetical protein COO60DRAFT_1513179 [Scenedesmus sp. NREL 46B-D3]
MQASCYLLSTCFVVGGRWWARGVYGVLHGVLRGVYGVLWAGYRNPFLASLLAVSLVFYVSMALSGLKIHFILL